jgi:hypothetical protein
MQFLATSKTIIVELPKAVKAGAKRSGKRNTWGTRAGKPFMPDFQRALTAESREAGSRRGPKGEREAKGGSAAPTVHGGTARDLH